MLPVIQYTTGLPGCGKTYVRCSRFVPTFLLNHEDGLFISNYPWNKEVIANYCAKIDKGRAKFSWMSSNKRPPRTAEQFLERMVDVPQDVLDSWRRFDSAPWDWLETVNLENAHVAIDEVHNFCPVDLWKLNSDLFQGWSNWLGEIRHQGLTIEFISQDTSKVSTVIEKHAAIRVFIESCEPDRDPFFRIQNHYWYNLIARFTGMYIPSAFEIEKRHSDKKWIVSNKQKFRFDTFFFKFYNSYSKPYNGNGEGLSEKKHPYQKYSRLGVLWWFFRDNSFRVLSRLIIFGLAVWLCMFGGLSYLINRFLDYSVAIQKANTPQIAKPVEKSSSAKVANSALASSASASGTVKNSDRELVKQMWPNATDAEIDRILKSPSLSKSLETGRLPLPKLVLISQLNIAFIDGLILQVGDFLPYDGWDKIRVKSFDLRKRIVTLSDKTVLRLGQ